MRLLTESLARNARDRADKPAFIFLGDGKRETARLTHWELAARARDAALWLAAEAAAGQPVLLVHKPGLGLVVDLLACFLARAIAIPLPPPSPRTAGLLAGVAADAGAALVLGAEPDTELPPSLRRLERNEISRTGALYDVDPAAPALIQYTSGSTGAPKGAVISLANLGANHAAIARAFGLSDADVGVFWLPPYHDMGLIGGVLGAVDTGGTTVLLPPLRAVQRPLLWLAALAAYRGTISAAPNFFYAMCNDRIEPAAIEGLDLSGWRIAICGAEPVHEAVLARFAARLAPAGFDPAALAPAYGLAENTLLATARLGLRSLRVEATELAQGRVALRADGGRCVTDCGAPRGCSLYILGPQDEMLGAGQVGEIALAGPSVAAGYWRRDPETESSFGPAAGAQDGSLFRTGDLGFLHEGSLFVTGRRREILILRGRNLYPEDAEAAAMQALSPLAAGRVAAFGVDGGTGEGLVLAFEPAREARDADRDLLANSAARAVYASLGVALHDFWLMRPGGMPLTTSGKLRRGRCRELYAEWLKEGKERSLLF